MQHKCAKKHDKIWRVLENTVKQICKLSSAKVYSPKYTLRPCSDFLLFESEKRGETPFLAGCQHSKCQYFPKVECVC